MYIGKDRYIKEVIPVSSRLVELDAELFSKPLFSLTCSPPTLLHSISCPWSGEYELLVVRK